MADDLEWRMARIDQWMTESYVREGAVERVLLAAIYRNTGELRDEVLTQTEAVAFYPGERRILYVALERMVDGAKPLDLGALWEEALAVGSEEYARWYEDEQPLSSSSIKDLRVHFDDMVTLTPTPAHVRRALEAYHGRAERLAQMYARFEEERTEKRDKRLRGEGNS